MIKKYYTAAVKNGNQCPYRQTKHIGSWIKKNGATAGLS